MTAVELSKLQQEDDSLEAVQKAARGEVGTAGGGFFKWDENIHNRWTPPGLDEGETSIDQLVLPAACRKAVLQLAHAIPLVGHMGRKKMAQQILARFYWPNVFKDATEICRTCMECQKIAPGKKTFCTPHSFANYRGAIPAYCYGYIGTSSPEPQWKQVYIGDLRLCNSIP